jgi:hypothetical protein
MESSIIHSCPANHFKGIESVGGKLILLKDRLHFKSHDFNIQRHELIIERIHVKEVNPRNNLFIIPNGIEVVMIDGKKEKFVVQGRKKWMELIGQSWDLAL